MWRRCHFFGVTSHIQPLILGYPWLCLYNPSIDRSTGNIKFRSEFCLHNCQPSGSTTGTKETLISLDTEYPDLSKVPGLQARATSLPPHWPYGSEWFASRPLSTQGLVLLIVPTRDQCYERIHPELTAGRNYPTFLQHLLESDSFL